MVIVTSIQLLTIRRTSPYSIRSELKHAECYKKNVDSLRTQTSSMHSNMERFRTLISEDGMSRSQTRFTVTVLVLLWVR